MPDIDEPTPNALPDDMLQLPDTSSLNFTSRKSAAITRANQMEEDKLKQKRAYIAAAQEHFLELATKVNESICHDVRVGKLAFRFSADEISEHGAKLLEGLNEDCTIKTGEYCTYFSIDEEKIPLVFMPAGQLLIRFLKENEYTLELLTVHNSELRNDQRHQFCLMIHWDK